MLLGVTSSKFISAELDADILTCFSNMFLHWSTHLLHIEISLLEQRNQFVCFVDIISTEESYWVMKNVLTK